MIVNDKENWLTLDQAADYLHVGKTKLYHLARSGKIPANRIGKEWRFKRSALDKWLSSSTSVEGYFKSVEASILDNYQLREPQREAYSKLYDFYHSGKKQALVQIPVGCGKSGLAAIAPFGISEGRVLVITPNLTIRDEMKSSLDITSAKCFWRKTNILKKDDMLSGPYVATLETGNKSTTDESHFVVTNIHQLATNVDKWLTKFPSDYFDMIIVDEAHHSPAESWQKAQERFPDAKILHLTATPFRSDAKKLDGERIYRYPFKSAMIKGYIKCLAAAYVMPSEIELTFRGEDSKRKLKIKDVIKYKEDDWFSRGIAMSDECNKSIVDNSIDKLEKLRDGSSIKHQLIAVAMSIAHAKKIKLLYEERHYEAEVIHSRLTEEDQLRVIKKLRGNEIDVIVNVLKLGEGFDHPQLSVAAIFRPYRTLSPYLQFVGRIMRVNVQNSPRHPDNYGFIVTHIGMNLDSLIDEFKQFEKDDEEFWARISGGIEPEPPIREENEEGSKRMIQSDILIHGESVDKLYEEEFIDDDQKESLKNLRDTLEGLGYDPAYADEIIAKSNTKGKTIESVKIPTQPQRELERLRKQIHIETNAKAKIVLGNAGLRISGRDISSKLFPDVQAPNNLVAVIIMLNKEIKEIVGKEGRHNWSRDDCRQVITALPQIASNTVRKLIASQGDKDDK